VAGAADVPVVAGAVADGGGMAAAADMAAVTAATAAAEDGTSYGLARIYTDKS